MRAGNNRVSLHFPATALPSSEGKKKAVLVRKNIQRNSTNGGLSTLLHGRLKQSPLRQTNKKRKSNSKSSSRTRRKRRGSSGTLGPGVLGWEKMGKAEFDGIHRRKGHWRRRAVRLLMGWGGAWRMNYLQRGIVLFCSDTLEGTRYSILLEKISYSSRATSLETLGLSGRNIDTEGSKGRKRLPWRREGARGLVVRPPQKKKKKPTSRIRIKRLLYIIPCHGLESYGL